MDFSGNNTYDKFYAESIVETVREPLLILDDHLVIKLANPSFYNTFQVTSEETLGTHIHELGNGQWDIPELKDMLGSIVSDDSSFNDFEVTHDFPGIGRRTMLLNGRRIVHESEPLPLILLAIEDITDRIEAKNEIQKYMKELERSNSDLEQFASVASHDLQEPLRKVIIFGDRLKSGYENVLGSEGIDYLERMQNASRRMQTLINGLLTLSRITTRGNEFTTVNLNNVVENALNDLEVTIQKLNASIEREELPEIYGDEMQMTLLFQNLIGNGLKYHREDTIPEIKIYNSYNKEDEKLHGKHVSVTVEDNGIGFEDKYIEKIFLPFQRLHGRGEFEGTGMGLTICKKIMERHNGKIDVSSRPGEGSRFKLIFSENI